MMVDKKYLKHPKRFDVSDFLLEGVRDCIVGYFPKSGSGMTATEIMLREEMKQYTRKILSENPETVITDTQEDRSEEHAILRQDGK